MRTMMLFLLCVVVGGVGMFGCSQSEDSGCSVGGSSCSDSYECCGDYICEDWHCVPPQASCQPTGSYCGSNGDCCSFEQGSGWCVDSTCKDTCASSLDCVSGCCAPTSIAGVSTCADASYCASCLSVRSYCTNAAECCGAMLCELTTGSLICCSQYGMGCVYDNDCCGIMLCYGGVCG